MILYNNKQKVFANNDFAKPFVIVVDILSDFLVCQEIEKEDSFFFMNPGPEYSYNVGDTFTLYEVQNNQRCSVEISQKEWDTLRKNFLKAFQAPKYIRFLGAYGVAETLSDSLEYEFSNESEKSATCVDFSNSFLQCQVAVEFEKKSIKNLFPCDAWTEKAETGELESYNFGRFNYPEVIVTGLPVAIIIRKSFANSQQYENVVEFAKEKGIEIKIMD